MNIRKALPGICAGLLCTQAVAEVTFYEGEDFRGRAFTTTKGLSDFKRSGFNDRASSVIVDDGQRVAGGVIGGVIGGILGHQIGDGRDIATAGGAVAGAAVGANVARGRDATRDVRRCETVQAGTPEYWDVRYEFRNVEHRAQMSAPPGRTIYVNSRGEPRQ